MNAEQDQFRFNPEGALWKVSRERAILIAGSSALLKQLAYPPVAEALEHTGRLEVNPVARLRRNAQAGFDLIFGTEEEVRRITGEINSIHQDPDLQLQISETVGAHKKGTAFSPRTQEGLGVVGATLIEGSVEGYRNFVGEVSEAERDEYVAEAKELFSYMGLKAEALPDSYDGVRTHLEEMIKDERIAVGAVAKRLAPYTMLAHTPLRKMLTHALQIFTFDLLPESLLRQYGYKITPGERKTARRRAEDIKKAIPKMPGIIRYNPQYRSAKARLLS